jgi:hypothetical protein
MDGDALAMSGPELALIDHIARASPVLPELPEEAA